MIRTAIINQKGGVGKTTTTANLGVALARLGKNVLLVDLDPQAHLTLHLGADAVASPGNTYSLLTDRKPARETICPLEDRLSLIPAHIDLAAAETELVSVIGRERILADLLSEGPQHFDFTLFDCPPSLGLLTLNGLCAANQVIIPMQAHFLALQGVGKLLETIQLVHNRINPRLVVQGVLLCMHDASTRLSSEVEQDLKKFFEQQRQETTPWAGARVFETVIRRNIKLAECPSYGKSVFDYAPRSNGAIDYFKLAEELLSLITATAEDGPMIAVSFNRAANQDRAHHVDGEPPLAHTG